MDSTGTMKSLLDKLTKLKSPSNPTDVFSVLIERLKQDLLGLECAVPKRKVCMKQARELAFEIEDWIDQKRETKINEARDQDPSDTQEIEYLMTKIKEALTRFTWYNDLLEMVPAEPDVVLDHAPSQINMKRRLPIEERPYHGLLDGPRDELVKHLTDKTDMMLKVVSVVGREGLGKTTLAKEIYSVLRDDVRKKKVLRDDGLFECQAFVSVGRRPDMKEILNDILHQVKTGSGVFLDVQEVITELREYLDAKRYFIVVDGIWSTWAWKVITCALPDNRGSRVMTTTCIIDVANFCSSYPTDLVYQMEALGDKNSKLLFRSRMTRQEERISDFEEVCGDMLLNMCGGMPLCIIIAADLLARKSEDPVELKVLGKFILSSLKQYFQRGHNSVFILTKWSPSSISYKETNKSSTNKQKPERKKCIHHFERMHNSDGMTKILHMSYADLPLPLRSCFLYLGVSVGNYTIRKDHLIWLWGAEGFIPKSDKECLWVTGERYFDELISRRLIQPVFTCDDDKAVGCTVHTVILDFVRSISREENFATRATELNSTPFPSDTIRRYSLDCRNEDEVGTLSTSSVHLSSMRSLTVLGKLDPPVPTVKQPAPARAFDPQSRKQGKHGAEEMHARVRMTRQSNMRPLPLTVTDVEGKLDPPDSPADDERISDPRDLPSDSPEDDEETHANEAPGVSTFNLSAFKLVRVLDLEDTMNLKNDHLKGIGGMVLLRYLGLAGTGITELPEELGRLEQLETLDLRRNTRLRTFPPSIVKWQKLRHLLLPGCANEIWEMPELEVASGIRVESSSSLGSVVELLKKCEQLRMLGLILKVEPIATEADLQSFVGEVVKSKLQSLSIDFRSDQNSVIPQLVDSWERVTAPLAKKIEHQRFEIRIRTEGLLRVPPNMGSLASLTHLFIIVYQAEAEDFLVLGGLTNLALLDLIITRSETERFIIKGGTFPRLKVFSFRIRDRWMGLKFEEGAMPQLQRFGRGFRVSERINQGYPDIGVEHLTCLTRVHATFNCEYATVSQVEALEADIRRQVSEIASKPALELSREYETMMRL